MKSSPRDHAQYVNLHTTPANGARFQSNYDTDVDGGSYTFPNAWLKLVRTGNTVIGYTSANGTSWTQVGSTETSLPNTITVGLFVSSLDYGTLSTATFDNVAITAGGASSSEYRYGFIDSSDAPAFLLSPTGNVVERYLNLPGGVTKTYRGESQRVFSLPNLHGDIFATVDAEGNQIATYQYDPFGNKLSDTLPNNTTGGSTNGWAGQYQKDTETNFTLTPTQMGARVYIAKLGRFLQVDPVEGGTPNPYIYPPNPVGTFDLDGKNMLNDTLLAIGAGAGSHSLAVSGGLLALGTVACLSGVGTLICLGAAVALPALVGGSQAYFNSGGNVNEGLWAGGVSALLSISGFSVASKLAASYLTIAAPRIIQQMKQVTPNVSQAAINRTLGPVRRTADATLGAAYSALTDQFVSSGTKKVTPGPSVKVMNNMSSIISGKYYLL